MRDERDYKQVIVSMLNMLGNRDTEHGKKEFCLGCVADADSAWEEGLKALGYEASEAGWRKMMQDNYKGFPR